MARSSRGASSEAPSSLRRPQVSRSARKQLFPSWPPSPSARQEGWGSSVPTCEDPPGFWLSDGCGVLVPSSLILTIPCGHESPQHWALRRAPALGTEPLIPREGVILGRRGRGTNETRFDLTSTHETGRSRVWFGERAGGRGVGGCGSGTPCWAFSSLGGCERLTTA